MNEHGERLWNLDDFLDATQGRPIGDMPESVDGISIDTRTLESGDAFFAIKGDQFDGHAFVTNAAGKQAALAVVSEDKLASLGSVSLPLIIVHDVLEAMEKLAVAARRRSKAKIIAITGSVGKTSTKEMLRTLLAHCGKVHASLASYNNHWGVPLTLSRLRADAEFGIFEIGMNHPGEIAPLVKMVRPHVAVITTIAEAHLGFFENVSEIAIAKGEIFTSMTKDGVALINRDIKQYNLLSKMAAKAGIKRIETFGAKRGASYWLKELTVSAECSNLQIQVDGKKMDLQLGIAGKHMAVNLMAALGAALLAGGEQEMVVDAVTGIGAVKGRGKSMVFGEGRKAITLIDESYNANPASMAASMQVLGMHGPTARGRRVAVLGDMLELGKSSKKLHKGLIKSIREAKIDRVWLVGKEISVLADELNAGELAGHFGSIEAIEEPFLKDLTPGDVIMIKASLGIRSGKLVTSVAKHLADR
ncbi:MAG: UDP-N-acetylmuramoyl-tripeptide--D-alanyl-D-alanine ligase [Hyphomicrobiales bacterium]|nr:UDP-N-acetylmuramoyl-tripeptide--D-alanyl-D-alanine ligase [Hyphomicrobiales bacterium]